MMTPPPKPWSTRNSTMTGSVDAMPHSIDAIVKSATLNR